MMFFLYNVVCLALAHVMWSSSDLVVVGRCCVARYCFSSLCLLVMAKYLQWAC